MTVTFWVLSLRILYESFAFIQSLNKSLLKLFDVEGSILFTGDTLVNKDAVGEEFTSKTNKGEEQKLTQPLRPGVVRVCSCDEICSFISLKIVTLSI